MLAGQPANIWCLNTRAWCNGSIPVSKTVDGSSTKCFTHNTVISQLKAVTE